MSPRRRSAAALAVFAVAGAAAVHAQEKGLAATRQAARRAFKAKRYAVACPLYEKVVALAPEDPPARADLAFCLQRQGRRAEAVTANYQALALAARTDRSPKGDEATRRHAYYNLSELGVSVEVPSKDACAPLAAPPGCARQLWACAQAGTAQGAQGGSTWTALRIGPSAADAEIEADEHLDPWSGPASDFTQRAATTVVVLENSYESRGCDDCGGDTHESCEVVVADACLGLVGLSCDSRTDGKNDQSASTGEAYLTPVR